MADVLSVEFGHSPHLVAVILYPLIGQAAVCAGSQRKLSWFRETLSRRTLSGGEGSVCYIYYYYSIANDKNRDHQNGLLCVREIEWLPIIVSVFCITS